MTFDLAGLAAAGRIDPGWADALTPVQPELFALAEFLDAEVKAGGSFLPGPENVLRAFRAPLDDVRVLIVGQDPYPTPGHPIGLSFAADPHVRPLPRSLVNIYRELHDDLGIAPAETGDLSPWTERGVLLLNRVLTVSPGSAGSHRRKGWETVTDCAITAIAARNKPLVSILWGRDAQMLAPVLGSTPRIESAHPSPLSASRGFFGSRPFSRTNELLIEQGAEPINWRLESTTLW
ncbi:uracil-DNA glycosylase [Mycetocola zhadangensis]|uniref:Uracil-DNA glycosylase n=1 Tax=Mycetocola zhadangensis TaxID=1164595 RepID=A0A3L7IV68_9MICO|nr:uracil-DNA glycosylase [Mycetocola zhadangensis]RLQ81461.1 uracil-DNA glycosylase [Mycetocola zhadangensis]GGF01453.1 uracil-DNA glycosylase [Mycetocola zhadangensis]